MHVRNAIIFALAGLPGCSGPCEQQLEPFSVDEELTEERVLDLMDAYRVDDRAELDCEAVCDAVREYEGDLTEYTRCALDVAAPAGDDPAELVGHITCEGTDTMSCTGRRPLGHVEGAVAEGLGGWLALAAQLEAASVHAFEELSTWLEARDAPSDLVARCRRAAADERVHARMVRAAAIARGVPPCDPRVVPAPNDTLDVALHNAIEGCVRETWGALLARWCARDASTAELRALHARLADDEARHAELAWDLYDWLATRLAPHERVRVDRARHEALLRLPVVALSHAATLPTELGIAPRDVKAVADRFARALLAA